MDGSSSTKAMTWYSPSLISVQQLAASVTGTINHHIFLWCLRYGMGYAAHRELVPAVAQNRSTANMKGTERGIR